MIFSVALSLSKHYVKWRRSALITFHVWFDHKSCDCLEYLSSLLEEQQQQKRETVKNSFAKKIKKSLAEKHFGHKLSPQTQTINDELAKTINEKNNGHQLWRLNSVCLWSVQPNFVWRSTLLKPKGQLRMLKVETIWKVNPFPWKIWIWLSTKFTMDALKLPVALIFGWSKINTIHDFRINVQMRTQQTGNNKASIEPSLGETSQAVLACVFLLISYCLVTQIVLHIIYMHQNRDSEGHSSSNSQQQRQTEWKQQQMTRMKSQSFLLSFLRRYNNEHNRCICTPGLVWIKRTDKQDESPKQRETASN